MLASPECKTTHPPMTPRPPVHLAPWQLGRGMHHSHQSPEAHECIRLARNRKTLRQRPTQDLRFQKGRQLRQTPKRPNSWFFVFLCSLFQSELARPPRSRLARPPHSLAHLGPRKAGHAQRRCQRPADPRTSKPCHLSGAAERSNDAWSLIHWGVGGHPGLGPGLPTRPHELEVEVDKICLMCKETSPNQS